MVSFHKDKIKQWLWDNIYNLSLQEHVSYDEKDETCDGIRFVALAVDTSTEGNKAKLTDIEKSIDFTYDDSNMDFNL